jgi:hypothetical protein
MRVAYGNRVAQGPWLSDCNLSTAGGVLFTSYGLQKLPDRYYKKLDETKVFSYTAYNFPALIGVCEKLARQAVVRGGGRIEKEGGEEVFVIPVKPPVPSRFEGGPARTHRARDLVAVELQVRSSAQDQCADSGGCESAFRWDVNRDSGTM